jgi:hypothetical protein
MDIKRKWEEHFTEPELSSKPENNPEKAEGVREK